MVTYPDLIVGSAEHSENFVQLRIDLVAFHNGVSAIAKI